jgi:hypothetical protein
MRSFLLFAVLIISFYASAQETAKTFEPTMFFVGLSVKDATVTQQWYIDKLNSRILKKADSVGPGIKFGLLEADGYLVEVLSSNNSVPRKSLLPVKENTISMQGIDAGLQKR